MKNKQDVYKRQVVFRQEAIRIKTVYVYTRQRLLLKNRNLLKAKTALPQVMGALQAEIMHLLCRMQVMAS